MSPERWQQVEALFGEAMSLAPAARQHLLQERCGGDADLLREVASLLVTREGDQQRLQPGPANLALIGAIAGAEDILADGTEFGPYRILRLLGMGGMGEVYLAEDGRLQRKVALKLLAAWIARDEHMMGRFTNEALAASALNHPNIPAVYETGTWAERRFIASEYVAGRTLAEVLRDGPLAWPEALTVARQVAEALRAAHASGIVHRDIKPGNILLRADGVVKVVDFGIAKFSRLPHDAPAAPITAVGAVIGTPGYMAPEQAAGSAVDARSDLWSLTAVLHQMVFGERPCAARPPSLPPGVPPGLTGFLERGLQTAPAERFQSAEAWLEALAALTTERPQLRGGPAAMRAAAALAVLALVAGGALFLGGSRAPPPGTPDAGALPAAIPSLAVLPFARVSGAEERAYLVQGLQDEITVHLGRISGLKVLAQRAVAGLPPQPDHLPELGTRLGVANVLEGQVALAADRVRVDVQLVDVRTGARRWSERYDRELREVFDVERDIAERTAKALRASLLPAERSDVQAFDTRNPAAHDALLKARFIGCCGQAEARKSLELLAEAVRLDPGYARAYAEMALAWYRIADELEGPEHLSARAKARAAAQHAIELAPDLADGHIALGWQYMAWDWDFSRAEHEFSQAAELAPNSTRAKNGLGTLYADLGEYERAATLLQQACELNPLDPVSLSNLGFVRHAQGHAEEAAQIYRRVLDLSPEAPSVHGFLALLALERGAREDAAREAAQEKIPDVRDLILAYLEVTERDTPAARRAVQQFIQANARESPFVVAEFFALRGDREAALTWLERAYTSRDSGLTELLPSGRFVALYGEPRFRALCRRLGVPPPAVTTRS